MKALVISGGGSKGAFAGGVAQFLIEELKKEYDIFIGTSTGSLMVSHLALGKLKELEDIYTNVNQDTIFSNCPFKIKSQKNLKTVSINHINTIKNFLKGSKTFGESHNLRRMIENNLSDEYLDAIRNSNKQVGVTVTNLTLNQIEYKMINDCSNHDFRDWIWASSNYIPFMSLMVKNHYEYADGGFSNMVPITEAINLGAKEIDAINLFTEVTQLNRLPSKNPFSLITNVFEYMTKNLEVHNVAMGKLSAEQLGIKLNLYYTPTVLTTNSLVFDKKLMTKWWSQGFKYAQIKEEKN